MFVFLDFETTSLRGDRKATEIGLVCANYDFEVEFEYESLVNPGIAIEKASMAVSRISQIDVNNANKFVDLWPEISQALSNRLIVCHNAPFDIGVLNTELDEIYDGTWDFPVICTKEWAQRILGDEVENHQLSTLCAYFDIPLANGHEALNDARATGQVFRLLHNMSRELQSLVERLMDERISIEFDEPGLAPTPRRRIVLQPKTQLELENIAKEILRNVKVQTSRIVVWTGDLEIGQDTMDEQLERVGLRLKETPPTQGTAFVIQGIRPGNSKIDKAMGYRRPVVTEHEALAIIELLASY